VRAGSRPQEKIKHRAGVLQAQATLTNAEVNMSEMRGSIAREFRRKLSWIALLLNATAHERNLEKGVLLNGAAAAGH